MNLWLDDKRDPPAGWVWVKTAQDAIAQLQTGLVEWVSLDHDLGPRDKCGTGYHVVRYMIEYGVWPPYVTVHSGNSVEHPKMLADLKRYHPLGPDHVDSRFADTEMKLGI